MPAGAGSGRVGVANAGWWGIPIQPSTTYHVSLYVRGAGAATTAPLTVDLESTSGRVWAAALHPGYMRIPGGNYLEGDTIATRFDWQTTIGPLIQRPGHFNSAWGYWSEDGMGLLVLLEGHQRALDGHPAPFNVKMVEIGNEDFFDTSGSYNAYRYPMFYDALHAADPSLQFIATEPVTSRPAYAVDDHYYNNDPAYFAQNAHLFDSMSRSGPKVLVGEYATTNTSPTGTLADALGESAFLTGTERNADLVIGASYAPLLVNVRAPSWPTNLIGYNALTSYGSPSYYAQKMLADGLGRQVIGTQVRGDTGTLFQVATESAGHTYLTVVNDGSSRADTEVSLAGLGAGASGGTATVLAGAPGDRNSLSHPEQVAPKSSRLPASLGTRFRYRFPADSLTVLDLTTSAASG